MNFAHFNKYFRFQRCSDGYSNINRFYSREPSSSRKSARWMLSKTSKHTLYSVVVTSKIMSTLVWKNNPILIDSLLGKEKKKNKDHFVYFQSCPCSFTSLHDILSLFLVLTAHDANRKSTFNPKYSTWVFDLKLFFNQYQTLFSQKYNISTLNSFTITSISSSAHVN